jgi:hypothetical protein
MIKVWSIKPLRLLKAAVCLSAGHLNYKIPKMTLHDRVKNKYASSKIGVKTVLSLEEETRLEKWALHMSLIGYGRTRKEIADVNSCKKNH